MNKLITFYTELRASQGLKQSIMTIIGDGMAAGMAAVALILFSRVLGPSKFGEFSVGVSVVLILTRLGDAGFAASTLKYIDISNTHSKNNQFFSLAIYFKIILSLFFAVLGFLLKHQIATFLRFPHPEILGAAFIFGISLIYYEQLLTMLQALHLFTKAVVINILQAGTKMIAAVSLFFSASTSSLTAFSLYTLAPLVPVILFPLLLPKWIKLVKPSSEVKSKMFGMVKHSSVAFIAAGLIENIDILFVQRYLTTFETGLYSGVLRIAMVLSLIAFSLGNVLYPRVARYKTAHDRKIFMRKAVLIGLLSLVGFMCFIPFTNLLIYVTIGNEYLSGANELIILAASCFILIASIPWIALFYSFKSNWYFSVSGLLQLAVVAGGNALFVESYGLEATAWTRLASRLFLLLFSVVLAIILYRKEMNEEAI